MSIIVKDDNGLIQVFCKGADTVIDERLKIKMDNFTQKSILEYTEQGLRILSLAKKEISE